jgi:BT1 family
MRGAIGASGLLAAIAAPFRGFRRAALPVLAIYGASGALIITAVADSFWVKSDLKLSAVDLATIAVWLQMPWLAKIIVAEVIDGSALCAANRRLVTTAGALSTAAGLLILAAAAQRQWGATPEQLYVAGQLLVVAGGVLQEVVADAMVPGIVPRREANGRQREDAAIIHDIAMIDVQARIVYTAAALVAGLASGWLAAHLAASQVFMIALALPILTIIASHAVAIAPQPSRAIDRPLLIGGLAMTAIATLLGIGGAAFAQELIFAVACAVLVLMLRRVLAGSDPAITRQIWIAAALAFAFRSIPSIGDGYRWYAIDRLGFDETTFGVLQASGTAVGLVLMWLLAHRVTQRPPTETIALLTATAVVLLLPTLLLAHGVHDWTGATLGISARQIALVDESAQTPLALLATVPLLALVAAHAPPDRRATWLALIASLMSLAIVAGQLITKALNTALPVERGDYANVPALAASVVAVSIALPLVAVWVGRRNNS